MRREHIVAFVLILLMIGGTAAYAVNNHVNNLNVSEDKQLVDLVVKVMDSSGNPAPGAEIKVYHLADGGPKTLGTGDSDKVGLAVIRMEIPREYKTTTMVQDVEEGLYVYSLKKLYACVNVWIVVFHREKGELGTWTTPVDPTWLKWPLDVFSVEVNLRKFGGSGEYGSSSVVPLFQYYEEIWKDSDVLQFAVWDQIWVSWFYPLGSKVKAETKERWYGGDWFVSGYTEVTVDKNVPSPYELTGQKNYTQQFELKYAYYAEAPAEGWPLLLEKVYAVDTNDDPKSYPFPPPSSPWNGNLPGYTNYKITLQGRVTPISIVGGCTKVKFLVDLLFRIVGIIISVFLRQTWAPPPPNPTLQIRAGTWNSGYVVRTESPDDSYLKTYSNWVPG